MNEAGLTWELANFVARPQALATGAAGAIVRDGFTDTLATMLGGAREPVVGIVREFVRARRSQAAEASVLLGTERVPSPEAALINGTAAHALDYDDVALGGHPSTVLVPAMLAEGEFLDASGAEAIEAYLVGYEVWAELAARETDSYHLKGWHPTAVLGTVAAAAAAGRLHRVPCATARNALALAASMAAGLVANFGSMTKPLHAGRAAACGIEAVRLALLGATAAHDTIEHAAGYLAALSPSGRAERRRSADGLGERLRLLEAGLSIKKYPLCYSAHRVIDGLLDIGTAARFRAEDVREVRVWIGEAQAAMLRVHAPTTPLEAKFSIEFAVAAALVAGRVGLAELSDAFVRDPRVARLMAKVRIATVDTHCPIEPVFALTDRVVVELHDGRRFDSGDIRFARGNPQRPLLAGELRTKFIDCAAGAGVAAQRLYDAVADLPNLDSMRRLQAAAISQ